METYEIRIQIDEAIARELLLHALVPDGIVMTPALNKAIADMQGQLGYQGEGDQVAGVSVTNEAGGLFAEITFASRARAAGGDTT
jgi:hypothetical protein